MFSADRLFTFKIQLWQLCKYKQNVLLTLAQFSPHGPSALWEPVRPLKSFLSPDRKLLYFSDGNSSLSQTEVKSTLTKVIVRQQVVQNRKLCFPGMQKHQTQDFSENKLICSGQNWLVTTFETAPWTNGIWQSLHLWTRSQDSTVFTETLIISLLMHWLRQLTTCFF